MGLGQIPRRGGKKGRESRFRHLPRNGKKGRMERREDQSDGDGMGFEGGVWMWRPWSQDTYLR